MAKFNINAWIDVTEEQARELNQHINGQITSDLYCQIAERLESINDVVPFYWSQMQIEIDKDNMFELCANKSLQEIKAMPTDSDMQAQAIRYYLSRILMDTTENNPLEDLEICIEENDACLSTLEMLWIKKIYQDEIEGCIYVWIDGEGDWTDIDRFSTAQQLTILEDLI